MKNKSVEKREKKERRHRRSRTRVVGVGSRPRLSVFRSNRHLYAQLINDDEGRTLVSASSKEIMAKSEGEKAKALGKMIAQKALSKKIKKVVFDRGGHFYAGKVKALAEGAREGGLSF
jgi:large subunit ribosomal protein L18